MALTQFSDRLLFLNLFFLMIFCIYHPYRCYVFECWYKYTFVISSVHGSLFIFWTHWIDIIRSALSIKFFFCFNLNFFYIIRILFIRLSFVEEFFCQLSFFYSLLVPLSIIKFRTNLMMMKQASTPFNMLVIKDVQDLYPVYFWNLWYSIL